MRKGSKERDGRDAPSPRRRRVGVARAAPSGHAQREHVVGVSVGRATSACRTRLTSRLRRGMAPSATRGPFDASAKIDLSRQRPDRARARAPMTACRCAQGTHMRMQDPCHPWPLSYDARQVRRLGSDRANQTTYPPRKTRPFKYLQHDRSRSLKKTACRPIRSKATSKTIDRNLLSTSRLLEGEWLQISSQLSAKKKIPCLSGVRVRSGDSAFGLIGLIVEVV